jgi:hypothetical protein
MITPALISYIEQSLKSGKSKDKIKSELELAGGWQESEINAAFATLQTGPYKKSFGSKVGSFFLTIFIVIIVIGGLAFAATKFLGPTASQIGSNIIAALPWKQTPLPAAPAPIPEPIVQAVPETQSAAVPTSTITPPAPSGPVKCAANDSTCLLGAAASCSPTSTTIITKVTQADLPNLPLKSETSTRLYTIVSSQDNQCTMKFSVKGDTNSKFAYKSATCNLSTTDLSTLLDNWTTGDYYSNTGVNLYSQCSGTYFNN